MTLAFVMILLFLAVAWGTWVISPLLVEVGLERTDSSHVKSSSSSFDPVYRFTTPRRLLQSCWATALLGGGLAAAALIAAGVLQTSLLVPIPLIIGSMAYQMPRLWLRRKIRQRCLQFQTRFVDITLALANALRSGASLPQSLAVVARDVGGPVGEEFNLFLHEYHLGVDLQEGFLRLARRMPSEDLQLMVTAVRLTMQSGGSLAEVLDKITDTIRQRTEFREKLRTMTAQGRFDTIAMTAAPAVAFCVLFLIDPGLMRPLLVTRIGWTALAVVALLETIGFLVIRRIVNVEA